MFEVTRIMTRPAHVRRHFPRACLIQSTGGQGGGQGRQGACPGNINHLLPALRVRIHLRAAASRWPLESFPRGPAPTCCLCPGLGPRSGSLIRRPQMARRRRTTRETAFCVAAPASARSEPPVAGDRLSTGPARLLSAGAPPSALMLSSDSFRIIGHSHEPTLLAAGQARSGADWPAVGRSAMLIWLSAAKVALGRSTFLGLSWPAALGAATKGRTGAELTKLAAPIVIPLAELELELQL